MGPLALGRTVLLQIGGATTRPKAPIRGTKTRHKNSKSSMRTNTHIHRRAHAHRSRHACIGTRGNIQTKRVCSQHAIAHEHVWACRHTRVGVQSHVCLHVHNKRLQTSSPKHLHEIGTHPGNRGRHVGPKGPLGMVHVRWICQSANGFSGQSTPPTHNTWRQLWLRILIRPGCIISPHCKLEPPKHAGARGSNSCHQRPHRRRGHTGARQTAHAPTKMLAWRSREINAERSPMIVKDRQWYFLCSQAKRPIGSEQAKR